MKCCKTKSKEETYKAELLLISNQGDKGKHENYQLDPANILNNEPSDGYGYQSQSLNQVQHPAATVMRHIGMQGYDNSATKEYEISPRIIGNSYLKNDLYINTKLPSYKPHKRIFDQTMDMKLILQPDKQNPDLLILTKQTLNTLSQHALAKDPEDIPSYLNTQLKGSNLDPITEVIKNTKAQIEQAQKQLHQAHDDILHLKNDIASFFNKYQPTKATNHELDDVPEMLESDLVVMW